jgi:CHASE3 domain sensor protein
LYVVGYNKEKVMIVYVLILGLVACYVLVQEIKQRKEMSQKVKDFQNEVEELLNKK